MARQLVPRRLELPLDSDKGKDGHGPVHVPDDSDMVDGCKMLQIVGESRSGRTSRRTCRLNRCQKVEQMLSFPPSPHHGRTHRSHPPFPGCR